MQRINQESRHEYETSTCTSANNLSFNIVKMEVNPKPSYF